MNPPIVLLPFSFVSGDRRGMPRAVRPGMYTASRFYPALIGPESGIFRGETGGFAADAQCCSVEGFNQKTNSHRIHLITGSKKSKIPYRHDNIYKIIWIRVKKRRGLDGSKCQACRPPLIENEESRHAGKFIRQTAILHSAFLFFHSPNGVFTFSAYCSTPAPRSPARRRRPCRPRGPGGRNRRSWGISIACRNDCSGPHYPDRYHPYKAAA